jgi:uncharacterized protein with von Willebrand factor type A (vWA) domain
MSTPLSSLENVGRLRGSIDNQIDRIKPAGRTYFLPAMAEARRQLERIHIGRRHIVLLSDGESGGNSGELMDLVKLIRSQSQITLSTVALGKESNIGLMTTLAQNGRGFFRLVCDPSILPQTVVNLVMSDSGSPPQRAGEAQKCP